MEEEGLQKNVFKKRLKNNLSTKYRDREDAMKNEDEEKNGLRRKKGRSRKKRKNDYVKNK